MTDVVAVNRRIGQILTDEGDVYPVTNWFDRDGDDCEPEDAVSCVAGKGALWFTVDLSCFENILLH